MGDHATRLNGGYGRVRRDDAELNVRLRDRLMDRAMAELGRDRSLDKAAGIRPFFTAVGISAVVVAMVTTRTYPRQFLHLLGEAWHWHQPPAAWIASAGIFLVPTLWVSRAVRAVAIVGFLLLVSLEIRADFREERENQAAMREILSEATGGSSYVYFEVSAAGGPYEVPITGVVTGNVSAQLFPRFVGDYPPTRRDCVLRLYGTHF